MDVTIATVRIFIFYAVQFAVSIYAFRRGGAPERTVAMLLLAAALVTSTISFMSARHYGSVVVGFLAIDLLLLAALCAVMVYADRYWPLWVAALQMLAVGVHAARAYDPAIVPLVYAWAIGEVAYPMLAVLMIGTVRHLRRERMGGPERGWWRHERRRPDWSGLT